MKMLRTVALLVAVLSALGWAGWRIAVAVQSASAAAEPEWWVLLLAALLIMGMVSRRLMKD